MNSVRVGSQKLRRLPLHGASTLSTSRVSPPPVDRGRRSSGPSNVGVRPDRMDHSGFTIPPGWPPDDPGERRWPGDDDQEPQKRENVRASPYGQFFRSHGAYFFIFSGVLNWINPSFVTTSGLALVAASLGYGVFHVLETMTRKVIVTKGGWKPKLLKLISKSEACFAYSALTMALCFASGLVIMACHLP